MVSTRSITWTCLLIQLVLSVACLVASMAVIAAKLQSVSIYEDKQYVSIEWWTFSVMSFAMILATVLSMLGLSGHQKSLLLPHLFLLFIFCLFVARLITSVILEFDFSEPDWVLRISILALAVLAGEMVFLIAGLTGLGMLHGWTEGVGYHMREYYTPLWLCAVLMCLLLVLVLSLFLVFVCLYCARPGIVQQHIMLLVLSWPVAVSLIISAVATSAPALVGLLLILYFTALLLFAYLYSNAKSVVLVAWLIVLLWLLSILVALVALFTNSYNLLLPHLVWTTSLFIVCVLCSITLLLSDTRPWTMILSSGISILLAVSILVETRCFLAMRRCLR